MLDIYHHSDFACVSICQGLDMPQVNSRCGLVSATIIFIEAIFSVSKIPYFSPVMSSVVYTCYSDYHALYSPNAFPALDCTLTRANWEWQSKNYRKVVYKSRGLCAIFQFFGAASIQVRILFEGNLYAMFWVCYTCKHGLAHVYSESATLRMLQNYFECDQTGKHEAFGVWKSVGFSPTWSLLGSQFQATVFECSLSAT